MKEENPYQSPTTQDYVNEEPRSKKFSAVLRIGLGLVVICVFAYTLAILFLGYDVWKLNHSVPTGNEISESLSVKFGKPIAKIGLWLGVAGAILITIARFVQACAKKRLSKINIDSNSNE